MGNQQPIAYHAKNGDLVISTKHLKRLRSRNVLRVAKRYVFIPYLDVIMESTPPCNGDYKFVVQKDKHTSVTLELTKTSFDTPEYVVYIVRSVQRLTVK